MNVILSLPVLFLLALEFYQSSDGIKKFNHYIRSYKLYIWKIPPTLLYQVLQRHQLISQKFKLMDKMLLKMSSELWALKTWFWISLFFLFSFSFFCLSLLYWTHVQEEVPSTASNQTMWSGFSLSYSFHFGDRKQQSLPRSNKPLISF